MAARSTSTTEPGISPNSSLRCRRKLAIRSATVGDGKYWRQRLSVYILVVDDEPDVEALFRQQFRRDLRAGRFAMEFAPSAPAALQRAVDCGDPSLVLILSDINMPGMSGLEMLPNVRGRAARRARHHDHRLWRRRDPPEGDRARRGGTADQADRFRRAASGDRFAGSGRPHDRDASLSSTTSPTSRRWSCRNSAARSARAR